MKKFLTIAFLCLSGTTFAAGPMAVFSGEVFIENLQPHAFDIYARIGQTETVFLGAGYVLELSVPSFNKSVARLKDADGKVLHESTTIGPVQERPSFNYHVCDSGVLFVSPARTDLPTCSI